VPELRKYTLCFSQLCGVMQSGGTCQFFTSLICCLGSRAGYIFGSQRPTFLQMWEVVFGVWEWSALQNFSFVSIWDTEPCCNQHISRKWAMV